MGMYPGGNLVKISPTVLASAYTAGDVIFVKNEIKNAVPSRGGCSLLRSVTAFLENSASDDDLTFLFFDNDTTLKESDGSDVSVGDAGTDITADSFRTASCIGMMQMDSGISSSIGNGRVCVNSSNAGDTAAPLFIKAAEGKTSIWVACIQHAGTLDLVDTDSVTITFGFEYLG